MVYDQVVYCTTLGRGRSWTIGCLVMLHILVLLMPSTAKATVDLVSIETEYQHAHPFEPTIQDIRASALDQARQSRTSSARSAGFPRLIQDVMMIVVHKSDGTGKVDYSALVAQIDELNRDFSAEDARLGSYKLSTDSGLRFRLGGVRYVENDEAFLFCTNTDVQQYFRPRYMADGAQYLNVYICNAPANLGLSWLPYQAYQGLIPSEDHFILGVIIHYELLPNNTLLLGRWNKGKICTHEVGHHYGLRHLYDGGCDLPDEYTDQIDDTPRQSGNPSGTCAQLQGRDSCPTKPGLDDNSNYMGIAYDSCRNHFTPGQVTFMQNTIVARKPTLMQQRPPGCIASVDNSDNSPDLVPCLKNLVFEDQSGRKWCQTDPDDRTVWAWACCPSLEDSTNWGRETCRQGAPNFSRPADSPAIPFGGPTDSPTPPTGSPTLMPSSTPTQKPTFRVSDPPTLAAVELQSLRPTQSPKSSSSKTKRQSQCDWMVIPGGPANENIKCQLPFKIADQIYDEPIPIAIAKPHKWTSYRNLQESSLWCPVQGINEYQRTSETKRALWGPAACVVQ